MDFTLLEEFSASGGNGWISGMDSYGAPQPGHKDGGSIISDSKNTYVLSKLVVSRRRDESKFQMCAFLHAFAHPQIPFSCASTSLRLQPDDEVLDASPETLHFAL